MKNQLRDAKGKFVRMRPEDMPHDYHFRTMIIKDAQIEHLREQLRIARRVNRLRPAFWGSICFVAGTIFYLILSQLVKK